MPVPAKAHICSATPACSGAAEINSSFHRPHQVTTYRKWADHVPDDFRFAVKLPRAITHDARLRGRHGPFEEFLEDTAGLGAKRGPLLVQLPPSLEFDRGVGTAILRDDASRHGRCVSVASRGIERGSLGAPRRCFASSACRASPRIRRRFPAPTAREDHQRSSTIASTAHHGNTGRATTTNSSRNLPGGSPSTPPSAGASSTTPRAARRSPMPSSFKRFFLVVLPGNGSGMGKQIRRSAAGRRG